MNQEQNIRGNLCDAAAILEWIDATAQRYEGMNRVCFYAWIASMLRHEKVGMGAAEWDDILRRASVYAEHVGVRASGRVRLLKRAS